MEKKIYLVLAYLAATWYYIRMKVGTVKTKKRLHYAPATKPHKNKVAYSRKKKHKKALDSGF